jgi:hypothetical protein
MNPPESIAAVYEGQPKVGKVSFVKRRMIFYEGSEYALMRHNHAKLVPDARLVQGCFLPIHGLGSYLGIPKRRI